MAERLLKIGSRDSWFEVIKMDIFHIFNPDRLRAFFKYSHGVKCLFQNKTVEACKAFAEAGRLHFESPVYHAMHGIALVDLHSYEPGIKELLLAT